MWKRGRGRIDRVESFRSSNREKKERRKRKEKERITSPFSPEKIPDFPLFERFQIRNVSSAPLSRDPFSRISTYSNSKKKRKEIHDPTRYSRASISLSFFFERARNRPKRRSHQRGARNFLPTDKRERFGLALPMQSRRRPR